MLPIRIRIRRKTKTPTKNNLVHSYRFDWKTVGVMDYALTPSLFKSIGGGPIKTDSQFARWLRDNYGLGIYSVIAWRKGREGFWGFMKVECKPETFVRLRKNKSYEQKEKEKIMEKYNELKAQVGQLDDEEQEELKGELNDMEDDLKDNNEILELEKSVRYGPSLYLKTIKPIYAEHLYESSGIEMPNQEKEFESLW